MKRKMLSLKTLPLPRPRAEVVGPVLLTLAGLILICIGLYMIYPPVGWFAAGLGAFYLESRIYGSRGPARE